MLLGLLRVCSLVIDAIQVSGQRDLRRKEPSEDQSPCIEGVFRLADSVDDTPEQELALGTPGTVGWLGEAEASVRALASRKVAPARLVQRAQMVYQVVFRGRPVSEVARMLRVTRGTVRRWVARFREGGTVKALEDRSRSGRPARLGLREQAVVLGLACQRPEDLGRLEGRMTQAIIVEEAAKQGAAMKRSSVQRIMALAEVKPYRERYYLFTVKDRPEFIARRDAICAAYTRKYPADEVLVCLDEKTGIQALGLPPGLPHGGRRPAAPGLPARIDQHYVRHGSRTLVAAVRPDTGKLAYSAVFPSCGYKSAETIEFLRGLAVALPGARVIHVVWDNGSTHSSHAMKEFLASEEGLRFRVLYTPPHASWLDLAENFFSRFSRRYLHGRRYRSLAHLDAHLTAALADYNRVARPMLWTYNPAERAAA